MKRAFDIIFSIIGIIISLPIYSLVWLLVKWADNGKIYSPQIKIGKNRVPFILYNFRVIAEKKAIVRLLKKFNLEGLPQLWNVLKGDISLIGPSSESREFVDKYRKQYMEILKIRPGLFDIAALIHDWDKRVLECKKISEGKNYYLHVLVPEKIKFTREYARKNSLSQDFKFIVLAFLKFLYPYAFIRKLISIVTPYRRFLVIVIQTTLFVASNYLAFYIRFEGTIRPFYWNLFLIHLPILIFVRGTFLFVFRLDTGLWRYAGVKDLLNIVFATSFGTGALCLIQRLLGNTYYPLSILIVDWFLNIFLLGGIRLFRGLHEFKRSESGACKRVIIIGGGSTAELLLRDIAQSAYPYEVIGFIDDNPRKRKLSIRNIPVLGTRQELHEIVKREEPDEFIIAIPSATKEQFESIVTDLRQYSIPIKTVPSLSNILIGKSSIHSVKVVSPEDVLFRPATAKLGEEIYHFLNGKRVLVTGAGGSIGSELSRQIVQCNPAALILFERHEENLYKIDKELKSKRGLKYDMPSSSIYSIIGDILDQNRLEAVMKKYKPEILIHAAAYKHVPLMEENPSEAFRVNVLGTRLVAQKAKQHNVKKFILISTDKAVNPMNVMGKTKKIAEEIVRYNSKNGMFNDGLGSTKYIAVRFGNVLDSSGSVVPLFKEQIEQGGPVTVTDPDMVRYFMTIPEAVNLVLQAAVMGEGGEIFVLDMGEPVKILDLAKRMISLYGYRVYKDIDIAFIGLRPGEKLYEHLFNSDEVVEKTSHPKINKAISEKNVDWKLIENICGLDPIAADFDNALNY